MVPRLPSRARRAGVGAQPRVDGVADPPFQAAQRLPPAQLTELAAARNVTTDVIALAAALPNPWASVVLSGAVTLQQLRANLTALAVGDLPYADLAALADLAEPPGSYWAARAAWPWH